MRKMLYILGELEDHDLHWLLSAGEVRTLAAGVDLLVEGGQADSLFIVLEGELAVTRGGRPLARLGLGEVVGEISLLDARPVTATVSAVLATRLFAVPYPALRSRLRSDESFSSRFHRALCLFLADRLVRVDALLESHPPKVSESFAAPPIELSELGLGSMSLAATRFDWFLQSLSNA